MDNNLQVIEKESTSIEIQAKAYKIISQKTYDLTANFLRGIKGLKKKVDDAFDEHIKQAHEAHKSLVAKKKEYYIPLENAEKMIKQKVKEYENAMEQKRLELEAKAREEAKETQMPPPPVAPTIERQKGLGIRKNWKFRIVDESKIPRTFLTPDLVKIGQTVRALKKDTNIPGVEAYEE